MIGAVFEPKRRFRVMSYEVIKNGSTEFWVDWSVMRRLVRSYWMARLQYYNAREVPMSDSHWYNPMSWSLPEVSTLEVDWPYVRANIDSRTDDDVQQMRERASYQAADVAHQIEDLIDEAGSYKDKYMDWMGTVQSRNAQAIDHAVDDYQSQIEVAKFVRDSCADGLMVGASVMSGGAAVAVMGGGSFLKGTAKFEDTGSIGAGVMEGAGSFVFAYVKLGQKWSFKEDMVLALVQAVYKTDTELVGGATLGKAALSGALKLTGPGVDRLFKLGPMKTIFDKAAVPIVITYGGENVASQFLGKASSTMVQKRGIEGAGKNWILAPGSSSDNGASNRGSFQQGQLMADATITSKYLLYMAYVNMALGIGRGW
jgi:hypothetical protein